MTSAQSASTDEFAFESFGGTHSTGNPIVSATPFYEEMLEIETGLTQGKPRFSATPSYEEMLEIEAGQTPGNPLVSATPSYGEMLEIEAGLTQGNPVGIGRQGSSDEFAFEGFINHK